MKIPQNAGNMTCGVEGCGGALYKTYHSHPLGPFACGTCGTHQAQTLPLADKMRTQKARGLLRLAGNFFSHVATPEAVLQCEEDVVEDGYTDELLIKGLHFARPCPKRPRHGFVDSRVVKSVEELKGVVRETLKEDPEGEVMVMKFIPSRLNVVWTPSMLTVGKGHDGATCGKDTINIPLSGKNPLPPSLLSEAGIGEGEWP